MFPTTFFLLVLCGFLWKWRCKRAFDSSFSSPSIPHLIINQFAKDWISANGGGIVKREINVSVGWVPPSEDWMKLNIDGSCDNISGHITAGGVMRDHWGNWVKGFVVSKGIGNVLEAELWGMFEGLSMVWNLGVRKIVVESDSLEAVQLLSNVTNINHPLFSLIQSCRHIMGADWECTVKHVYREGNRLADGLAHIGHSLRTDILFFEDPPFEIASIFDDDCRGVTFVRQCAAPVSLIF